MEWLRLLGWLACVVYSTIPLFWILVHSRVESWRSRSRSPYRVLLPVWVVMWFGMAVVTSPIQNWQLYSTPWAWVPAIGLLGVGLWLYKASSRSFSPKQLGGLHELAPQRHQQVLVTSGIRSRVRHPVYLAHVCEMLAWSVGTGLAVCYALTLFAVLVGSLMVRMEERELEKRMGSEYQTYRAAVPAILPRLWGS
jgi:protein-S-isoprenylcysteine O-methyltransferase Ste14